MKFKTLIVPATLAIFAILSVACGGSSSGSMKKILEQKAGEGLTVTLSNSEGQLKNGEQQISLSFKDAAGKPVEISAASLNFNMPAMGSMSEMNSPVTLRTTGTPGEFTGNVNIQMAGEWIAQVSYEGKKTGKTTLKVTAY